MIQCEKFVILIVTIHLTVFNAFSYQNCYSSSMSCLLFFSDDVVIRDAYL